MANEPIYNVASMDHKSLLCSAQTVVETRILPFAGVSISKVLSYSADGAIETTDVFAGEARVGGKITFRVLFLDAEGNCRTSEVISEFTDKIADDSITGQKPALMSRILDIDITSLSADEIKLAAIVQMDLYDNVATRIKYLQVAPEDVYATEANVEYLKLIAKSVDTFSLSGEMNVDAERILLSESRIVNCTFNAGIDNILASGEIITFAVTEKGGEISGYKIVTPFSNECSAEGSKNGSVVDGHAKLIKATPVLMLDENSSAISVEYDVEVCAHIYGEEVLTPISDAFSIVNQLNLNAQEIEILKNRNCKYVSERVEGSVTLSNDMPIADRILAHTGAKLNIANCYSQNGKLVLEGTVNASIIYFSQETKSKNSVAVELPFSLTTNENIEGQIISCHGEVADLSAKIHRGSEIDIRAEISVCTHWAGVEKVRIIGEMSVGERIEIPLTAISLHIGRPKESLWDIAKALRATPELIMLQNPELNMPLAGGERVIIYRHLKKN